MRYFFHRLDGSFDPDTTGTELENLDEARLQAILFAAGTIRDHPEYVWHGGEMRIEVTDESALLVTTVIVMSIDAADPGKMLRRLRKDD